MLHITKNYQLGLHAALLLSVCGVSGCESSAGATEKTTSGQAHHGSQVRLGRAEAVEELPSGSVLASMTLVSGAEQELHAPLGGRLVRWLVSAGERVEAGTPLAEWTSEELVALRAEESSQLKISKAKQSLLESASKQTGLGLASQQTVREAQAAVDEAQARLESIRAQLRSLEPSAQVQRQGGRSTWLSPVSGTVTALHCIPGQRISPSDMCLKIVDHGRFELSASFPQEMLSAVREAKRGRWRAVTGEEMEVKLTRISPTIDATHRLVTTFWAWDALPDTAPPMMAGLTGRLTLQREASTGEGAAPVLVDKLAVTRLEGRDVVCVPDGDKKDIYKFLQINVLAETSRGIIVSHESLKAGDEVVVRGVFALKAEHLMAQEAAAEGEAP